MAMTIEALEPGKASGSRAITYLFRPRYVSVMLIDLTEAAARLGISEHYVRALTAKGGTSALRVSGRWVIDDDDVSLWPWRQAAL